MDPKDEDWISNGEIGRRKRNERASANGRFGKAGKPAPWEFLNEDAEREEVNRRAGFVLGPGPFGFHWKPREFAD